MDNWRLSWHPSLISRWASSHKLSGMVQGVPNWKEPRQPCFKKRGELTGFCLIKPLAFDWRDSGVSRHSFPVSALWQPLQKAAAFWRNPLLPAPCFINYSPTYLWTISFRHLSSSYFLNGQGFSQSQLSFPLWCVSFDNSESTNLVPLVAPNSHPLHPISHPVPTATFHGCCHYCPPPPSSWLYWKISRPGDLGLVPSATQTQIIRKASQCLPALQLLPVLQMKEF